MNKKLYYLFLIPFLLVVYAKVRDRVAAFYGFNFKEFCVSVSEIASATPEYILKAFSISNKDKLDRAVGEYWYEWKSAGKDTTNCILDFDKIMHFEWDTLVYIKYDSYSGNSSDELEEYIDFYFGKKKRHNVNKLHLLHKGKLVHEVELFMMSDDAKGFFLCTEKDFIKRARGDAKFHLVKDGKFFVVRDITEHFVPMIGF